MAFTSEMIRCVSAFFFFFFALWQIFFYQPSAKCSYQLQGPKIPPGARSLCNYRCKPACGRLPGFVLPLPVKHTLPTTFRCVSCFCDLMLVSPGVYVLLKITVLLKLLKLKYIVS